MSEKVSIIIPTWNNYQYLESCLNSILSVDFVAGLFHIYVVNNGHKNSCDFIPTDHPRITVINTGKNLGWEGGLKAGLEKAKGDYIIFMNDDAFVPQASSMWISKMLNFFHREKIGAVGPSSNVVMGNQNIFSKTTNPIQYVNYLIGFCIMVSRKALEEVGGVDDTLPGGDDLDLSIRLRKAGYRLVCDRSTFVYHHGFKTGERIHGGTEKPFGWNSYEFKEKTDFALIRKHGFRWWFETLYTACRDKDEFFDDSEGDMIRSLEPKGVVLDLGCGGRKTVPNAVGVDLIPKGQPIDSLGNTLSVADIVADVSQKLPIDYEADCIIARHILEHTIDPIDTLSHWANALKSGGRMIIAVPDETKINSIPMNFEHKHAFTKESLGNNLSRVGMLPLKTLDPQNGISFIIEAQKL